MTNRERSLRRRCPAMLAGAAATMILPSTLLAQDTGGGMEGALIVTGVLTLILISAAFLVLIVPGDDRRRIAESWHKVRAYLLTGSTRRVTTLDDNFDGIQELDNRIPPWFTTLFAATIVFAAAYLLDYHVFRSSKLSQEEYADEVAAADLRRRIALAAEGTIDEAALVPLRDPAALTAGKEQFLKNCVSCHAADGGGGVGPNLTDDYWIHGGGIKNVYATIKNGVPEKGMISWKLVFTPRQIQQIASYVLSLRGTHPAAPKAPQGDLYVEKDTTAVTNAAAGTGAAK